MSNIIRLNETAPNSEWLVLSNQGTDCFLENLLCAADALEQTAQQKELVAFLKAQKEINEIAPGTAGFDLTEMPWQRETLQEDADFLLRAAAEAESVFGKSPYEINRELAVSRLRQFAALIGQMKNNAIGKTVNSEE